MRGIEEGEQRYRWEMRKMEGKENRKLGDYFSIALFG